MRFPFLVLTPVCVFLGASTVIAAQTNVSLLLLVLALLGALLAHVSVNTLNEYFDYKSGLDFTTTRTQFSGGSGALPRNPEMLSAVFTVGIASLIATLMIGGFFIIDDPIFGGLGIALIFGSIAATVVSLFLVPVLIDNIEAICPIGDDNLPHAHPGEGIKTHVEPDELGL